MLIFAKEIVAAACKCNARGASEKKKMKFFFWNFLPDFFLMRFFMPACVLREYGWIFVCLFLNLILRNWRFVFCYLFLLLPRYCCYIMWNVKLISFRLSFPAFSLFFRRNVVQKAADQAVLNVVVYFVECVFTVHTWDFLAFSGSGCPFIFYPF